MKKTLIAFLLSCSCALTLAAVACGDKTESSESIGNSSVEEVVSNSSSSTESANSSIDTNSSVDSSTVTPSKPVGVTLTEGAGYFYENSNLNGTTMNTGDVLSFSIRMSVFYTGYPVVAVNGKAVLPNDDGVYSIEITEESVITVSGVQKEISNMQGTGAFDDAYVVSRPVDLLYIAEQVNKGVRSYVTGAYVLGNDIDCGGEELKIIGDLSTENSYFSGCFSCVTNSETGEMERYTISNFTINSDSANYVGLFGAVYSDFTVTSSGLFYGIRLDNFTINASISPNAYLDSRTISCGALIGYGVGANVYLCDATNGEINLYGDSSYFSFAGGLIGYQQAYYDTSYGAYFPSEVVYSVSDVDIRIVSGMALYAGGISGYLATNYPFGATAFIHNSYSHGNVSGALRSGGIAGGLGQYTSVSNTYATGEIVANCTQSLTDALTSSPEYCYAHAGGLVGFAENDTIVNDSFFAGSTKAYAVTPGCAITGDYIAGGHDDNAVSATSTKYVIDNCINTFDSKDVYNSVKDLGWQDYDWVLDNVTYPEIFYGTPSGDTPPSATMQFTYVTLDGTEVTVNGASSDSETYFNMATEASNIYAPLGSYLVNGLQMYYEADNGYLSFGFFFDKECTQKVPYSYVPEKNVEIFIGFADPTPIVGTYYVVSESTAKVITMHFAPSGIVTYTDGYTEQEAYFLYNGETLIVEGARLARYFDGAIVVEDTTDETILSDPNFDLYRYMYYDFIGSVDTTNKIVYLYDLVYFTKEAPLVAKSSLLRGEYVTVDGDTVTYYEFYGNYAIVESMGGNYFYAEYDGIAIAADGTITLTDSTNTYAPLTIAKDSLAQYDMFKGTWSKSATINKSYSFDGLGNWTYAYKAYTRSGNPYMGYTYEESLIESAEGTYTVENGVLTFTHNGVTYTASFDADGFLSVNNGNASHTYYRAESYVGSWSGSGISLELLGVQQNGTGKAIVTYEADGYSYDLVYELSETKDYVVLYLPHAQYWKDTVFGYFTYDVATNTLIATIYDPYSVTSGYTTMNMFVTDDYEGEWICNEETLQNVEFYFNGYGLYGFLNGYAGMKGEVVLVENGKETVVEYTLDSSMKGNFSYGGVHYVMTYDEEAEAIILTAESGTAQLEHKDRFAGLEFIDEKGNVYVFDGKSNLSIGGNFTINGAAGYKYVANGESWNIYKGNALVGTLAIVGAHYELTIDSNVSVLNIVNEFMGEWAISGMFSTLTVGSTNLNGEVSANFMGNKITLTYLDNATLTFRYMDGSMPVQYYIFVVFDSYTNENVLVLSQYTSIAASGGDYMICTKANDLFGTWTLNKDKKMTISFDGVTSGYVNGVAHLSRNGNATPYFYAIYDNGILFWSQDLLGGKTLYYKIVEIDLEANPELINDPNAYVSADGTRAIYRIEVDGLYLTEAKDSKDNTIVYFFDGEGNLLVNGETVYTYVIKSYNNDSTATLEVTDVKTGITYSATLDYSNANNEILTIGEPIKE